jgi:hypothetical protein
MPLSADHWPDEVRLFDVEPRLVCRACGRRGIRPDFNWDRTPAAAQSYDVISRRHFYICPRALFRDAGSIDTRTDIQQAKGFLLAQESMAACDGGG